LGGFYFCGIPLRRVFLTKGTGYKWGGETPALIGLLKKFPPLFCWGLRAFLSKGEENWGAFPREGGKSQGFSPKKKALFFWNLFGELEDSLPLKILGKIGKI